MPAASRSSSTATTPLQRVPSWVAFADDPFHSEGISFFSNEAANSPSTQTSGYSGPAPRAATAFSKTAAHRHSGTDWLSMGVEGIKSTFASKRGPQLQSGLPSPPASVASSKSGFGTPTPPAPVLAPVELPSDGANVFSSGEVSPSLQVLPGTAAPASTPLSTPPAPAPAPAPAPSPESPTRGSANDLATRTLSSFPACGLVRRRTGTAFLLPLRPLQQGQDSSAASASAFSARRKSSFIGLRSLKLPLTPFNPFAEMKDSPLGASVSGAEHPKVRRFTSASSRSSVSETEAEIAAEDDDAYFDVFNALERADDRGCRSETASIASPDGENLVLNLEPLELAPIIPLAPMRIKSLQRPKAADPPPRPERRRPIRPQSALLSVGVAIATAAAIAGGRDYVAITEADFTNDAVDQGAEADTELDVATESDETETLASTAGAAAANSDAREGPFSRDDDAAPGPNEHHVPDLDAPLASRALEAVLAPAPARALFANARTLHLSLPDLGRAPRALQNHVVVAHEATADASVGAASPQARGRAVSPPPAQSPKVARNASARASGPSVASPALPAVAEVSKTESMQDNVAFTEPRPAPQPPATAAAPAARATAKQTKRHSIRNTISSKFKYLGKRIADL